MECDVKTVKSSSTQDCQGRSNIERLFESNNVYLPESCVSVEFQSCTSEIKFYCCNDEGSPPIRCYYNRQNNCLFWFT